MMKRLKYTLNLQTLQKIVLDNYSSNSREWLCFVDNCTQSETCALENVQLDAARVSVGAFWNTNREKLLQEVCFRKLVGLKLVGLSCRRQYYKWVLFYKVRHNMVRNYLHGSLVSAASEAPYNLHQP